MYELITFYMGGAVEKQYCNTEAEAKAFEEEMDLRDDVSAYGVKHLHD